MIRFSLATLILFSIGLNSSGRDSLQLKMVPFVGPNSNYSSQKWEPKEPKSGPLISSNNYIGIDMMWPNLKREWKSEKPWVGFNGQLGFLRFGMGYGSALKLKDDGQVHREEGRYAFLGGFVNKPLRLVRNFIAIEPELGLDITYGRLDEVPGTDAVSMGIGLTPGIGLKVGPVKIVGKYSLAYAIPFFNKPNAWRGGMSFPIIGVYFETGWGIMNPRKISSGGIITTKDISKTYSHSEKQNGTWYDVYREVTTYTDRNAAASTFDVRPYWYINAKANSSEIYTKDRRQTIMFGVGGGLRYGFFGAEGFYTKGKLGFGSPIDPEVIRSTYGALVDLTGYREANQWGAMGGVDIVALLTRWIIKGESKEFANATPFTRFMFMWGMGQTTFTGPPVYNESAAPQQIVNIPSLSSSGSPAKGMMPTDFDKSNYSLFSFRFEMGVVSVGFERYNHKDAKFASGRELTLGFQIPPARLVRFVSAQWASIKYHHQNKKE